MVASHVQHLHRADVVLWMRQQPWHEKCDWQCEPRSRGNVPRNLEVITYSAMQVSRSLQRHQDHRGEVAIEADAERQRAREQHRRLAPIENAL